jgi:two-component system, NarL family, nitrate/nitrite response regulator NarL
MTRVLIVDDHVLFAEAIKSYLSGKGIDITGTCGTGEEAMEAIRRDRPDLVLLDLGLPDESGLSVGRRIVDTWPGIKVLALTAMDSARAVKEAMISGLHGYLTKDVPLDRFVSSIESLMDGNMVMPHRLGRRAAGWGSRQERDAALLAGQLTRRERQVLALLAEGASGSLIARRLWLSPHTVRTHVQSILGKLRVHSRLEAAAFAMRHGIVKPPTPSGDGPDSDAA